MEMKMGKDNMYINGNGNGNSNTAKLKRNN